ncbi:MAG: cytochrome b/b6 domain-containing protein [Nitrospirota bacterium]|nr:cytochrome b/b6 domain-containing protein [Nitrospirota bacterium]
MAVPQIGGHHPFIVKIMHWLNVALIVVMLVSGLVIWLKHPSFFDFPEKLADRKLFDASSPFGGPLIWHFAGLWLLMANWFSYVLYTLFSGNWREIIFRPSDIGGLVPQIKYYLGIQPVPPSAGKYNPLQKLAYNGLFVMAAATVVTGFALYKPAMMKPIIDTLGGPGWVRLIHFALAVWFILFIAGHAVMGIWLALKGVTDMIPFAGGKKKGG